MRAKKSLGQNFLKSKAVVRTMVEAANVSAKDTVLEVGPGRGVLTSELLNTGATVIAVEKDAELIPILTERFNEEVTSGQLVLHNADISEFNLNNTKNKSFKLVANIPYYITGEIIKKFLTADQQPTCMTLLVQKEVAQRIVARDSKESILSNSVKVYGTPKYVQKVAARLFSPAPKVDSAVLHIAEISKKYFTDNAITEDQFFATVKKGFAQKRKKLTNNLSVTAEALATFGLDKNVRAESLTLTDWAQVTKAVTHT